jgi:serine/threonine protein kinase
MNSHTSGIQDDIIQIDVTQLVIGQRLGQGVSATIFKAEYMGQNVAVKRMENQTCSDDFLKEMKFIFQLRHDYIVGFRGMCCDPSAVDKVGTPIGICLVMQYAKWGSLFDVMKDSNLKREFSSWSSRLLFLSQAASGIHFLHFQKQPIIHRDIKPGNILVTEQLRPLIADFGLSSRVSCDLDDELSESCGEGTLAYMAPELFDGESPSPASDVYAFGMLIWFMASAAEVDRPFSEPWCDKMYIQVQSLVLSGIRPSWPAEIENDSALDRIKEVKILSSSNRPVDRLHMFTSFLKLQEYTDTKSLQLTRRCWSQNPMDRPIMGEIAETLKVMAYEFPKQENITIQKSTCGTLMSKNFPCALSKALENECKGIFEN